MGQSAFLPVKPYILIGNRVRVKSSGLALGVVNARPPGSAIFANAPPPGLTRRANAPQFPGGEGWAQVELTDALSLCFKPPVSRFFAVFKDDLTTRKSLKALFLQPKL